MLISLPYLPIDHYVKTNPIHFIQGAIGFTILILVIPGISAREKSVTIKVQKTKIKTVGQREQSGGSSVLTDLCSVRCSRGQTWSCILMWPSCSSSCPNGWNCTVGYTVKSLYPGHSSTQLESRQSHPDEQKLRYIMKILQLLIKQTHIMFVSCRFWTLVHVFIF